MLPSPNLIQRIQRRVSRRAPGLIDFRRRPASAKLFRYMSDLRAARAFRRALHFVWSIVHKSIELSSDLMKLEEKRLMDG